MTLPLGINDLHVTSRDMVFSCHGLGSCVGLFITDRTKKLSGGAHIPVAFEDACQWRNADSMIEHMLAWFQQQGSDLTTLRAKLAGGASVYSTELAIGKRNIEAVVRNLTQRRVYIAALDVGGCVSRTARYDTRTELLHISTSEQKQYSI